MEHQITLIIAAIVVIVYIAKTVPSLLSFKIGPIVPPVTLLVGLYLILMYTTPNDANTITMYTAIGVAGYYVFEMIQRSSQPPPMRKQPGGVPGKVNKYGYVPVNEEVYEQELQEENPIDPKSGKMVIEGAGW